uniref:Uncharacterized protein n=1 Tax=Globisporangium ultimum (strain ATCC 200006 / CBS 805.95 / DAOM BR144) TaxID=431595 RepID=K3W9B1_GLOUD
MKAEDHDLRTAYMAADDGDLHVLQSNGSLTRFDDDGDIDDVRPSSHVHAVHKYHPASLRVQILAMRILVCTTLFCVLIAVAMVVFSRSGVRLETFLSTAKDDVQRKDLLDSYNSYSGNIVSLLTKPFELFLTMVVAVTFLCFATEFSLRDYGMRATYAFIVVSALCGYFLTNGFNALNVQLSSRAVRPIVTADDLALPGSTNGTAIAINDTFSSSPRIASPPLLGLSVNNPLNNTVFKAIIGIERLPPTANCGSWAGLGWSARGAIA